MYNLVDLTDKKIIVTGASSGIGRETAIVLSKLGAQLILVARRQTELEETLGMLEKGREHCCFVADLSNTDSIEDLIKTIVDKVGPIDGMAYCAGIVGDYPLKFLKPDRFENVMKINLEGFIEMVRCVTIRNRFNSGMRIVGVSSVASLVGSMANTAYAASKGGMDSAVRCMSYELSNKGVCLNTVAPSMIMTEMTKKYLCDEDSNSYKNTVNRQYLGVGQPNDIANGIAFLLSPAARFITGVCLPIDGGWTSI